MCSANDTTGNLVLRLDSQPTVRLPPALVPPRALLRALALVLGHAALQALGEIDGGAGGVAVVGAAAGQPGEAGLDIGQGGALDVAALAGGEQMLARVEVVDQLPVVLERQVAVGAVEARAAPALAQGRARRHQAGLAHVGAHVQPRAARHRLRHRRVRRRRARTVVLVPGLLGLVPGARLLLFGRRPHRRFGRVFGSVPRFAEGRVRRFAFGGARHGFGVLLCLGSVRRMGRRCAEKSGGVRSGGVEC